MLCTATIDEAVPQWREPSGKGWITAEYDMLPGSTGSRRARNRMRVDGRTQEIQRLIGRSLRAIADMAKLGPRTIYLDCDVLQADGGTRTASITGAYVALCDALHVGHERSLWGADVLTGAVGAVSVGIVDSELLLDLDYQEDSNAGVDCNLVMTSDEQWVEVQATAEQQPYGSADLAAMMELGRRGIVELFELQRAALSGKQSEGV